MRPLRDGETAMWLLEISWAGRVWRFASETIRVERDGVEVQFLGGLRARVRREIEPFGVAPSPASAEIEVVWPESIAALVALGHDLSAATAQLLLHVVGREVDPSELVIEGRIVEPSYDEWLAPDGTRHSTVTASVEEQPWTDAGAYPPSERVVSAETWPLRDPDYDGRVYPLVWGQPGRWRAPDGSSVSAKGSPALVIEKSGSDNDLLLICGERVAATQCVVWHEDSTSATGWTRQTAQPITYETDGRGTLCAVVDLVASGFAVGDPARTSGEYWIEWLYDGGLISPNTGEALTGLGDLLAWFLARVVGRVDHLRMRPVRTWLNRWRTAGYVDEQITPWTWIVDNILPLIPVSVTSGPSGLILVPWRWSEPRHRAELWLTEGAGAIHVSPVEYVGAPWDRTNALTLRWAIDPGDNQYKRQTTITPTKNPDDVDEISALVVRQSHSRLGKLVGEEITTDILFDRNSAALTLLWRVHRSAAAPRRVAFDLPPSYAHARPGHRIDLASEHLLLDCVGNVMAVEIDDHMRVRLEVELGLSQVTTGSVLGLDDDPKPPEQ